MFCFCVFSVSDIVSATASVYLLQWPLQSVWFASVQVCGFGMAVWICINIVICRGQGYPLVVHFQFSALSISAAFQVFGPVAFNFIVRLAIASCFSPTEQ